MYTTQKRPPSQARTPLGAQPNLQNDPRMMQVSRTAADRVMPLVNHCDRNTAAIEGRCLSKIAEWCRVSERTLRRHLKELARVGLIEYEPGNGRGNTTVVRLLYETWGKPIDCHQGQDTCQDDREEKPSRAREDHMKDCSSPRSERTEQSLKGDKNDTSESPISNDPARKSPENYGVECTSTLHNDTDKPVSLSKAATIRILQFVYRFHAIAGTSPHKLTPYFIERECSRVVAIFNRYPEDHRRHAWRLMMRQYGRPSNRRPMQSIALWADFCLKLPEIAADLRSRVATKAYKRLKAAGEIVTRSQLRKLEAALLLELEESTHVPIGAIAKSSASAVRQTPDIKVAAWEREVEHEEQKREREKRAPEAENILSQIMNGTTFEEWSENNEGTGPPMSMRE